MSEGSLTPSMARFASAHVFVVRGGGVGGGGGAKGLGRGITIVDFFGGAAGTLDDGWFSSCPNRRICAPVDKCWQRGMHRGQGQR